MVHLFNVELMTEHILGCIYADGGFIRVNNSFVCESMGVLEGDLRDQIYMW